MNLKKQNPKQKTIHQTWSSSVKLRKGGRKSEQLRKKERQIEKEMEAINHGWVNLEVAAMRLRGKNDEIGHGWWQRDRE